MGASNRNDGVEITIQPTAEAFERYASKRKGRCREGHHLPRSVHPRVGSPRHLERWIDAAPPLNCIAQHTSDRLDLGLSGESVKTIATVRQDEDGDISNRIPNVQQVRNTRGNGGCAGALVAYGRWFHVPDL